MSETAEKFDQWAVVEVMGHKKYAGRVTEQQIGGAGLVRVDVPETVGEKTHPAYSKLIGPSSMMMMMSLSEQLRPWNRKRTV